jgi:hypothetical protein
MSRLFWGQSVSESIGRSVRSPCPDCLWSVGSFSWSVNHLVGQSVSQYTMSRLLGVGQSVRSPCSDCLGSVCRSVGQITMFRLWSVGRPVGRSVGRSVSHTCIHLHVVLFIYVIRCPTSHKFTLTLVMALPMSWPSTR